MPRTKISEFSATPASNTDIDSINISEGCAPSGINDAIRELMAQLKDFQTGAVGDSFNGPVGTTTAAAGAFTTLSSTGNTTLGDASGDSVTINGTATFANANPTLSAGTANGVTYLNGSKVVTSGSALTFDGTNFGVGTASPTRFVDFEKNQNAGTLARIGNTTSGTGAYSALQLSSSATTYLYNFSNAYTTSGKFAAGSTLLDAGGTGGLGINAESVGIIFYTGSTEQMRLTSTGLGIGTSSPSQKLEVAGNAKLTGTNLSIVPSTATSAAYTLNTNTGGNFFLGIDSSTGASFTGTAYGRFLYSGGAYPIVFLTNDTERMRLDSSGNLGLGVTPFANSLSVGLDLAGGAGLFGFSNQTELTCNAYYSAGAWRYKATANAALYQMQSGQHQWNITSSGTAGNTITFTQAMTLDAGGRLLVGTTTSLSSSYAFQVGSSRSGGFYSEAAGAGDGSFVSVSNAIGYHFYAASTTQPKFYVDTTGNTYNAGNLLVGTTSSSGAKFVVDGDFSGSFGGRVNTTATTGYMQQFQTQGTERGYIYSSSSGTTYNTVSDYRLKNTIAPMTGALAKVALLKPCTYKWNVDGSDGEGFIAHELAEVVPQCVTGEKDAVDEEGNPKYQGIDTSFLVATLTAAIQELKAEFDAYKASHP